jgi:membrane fusion protein (multidrug efflux system)
MLAAVVLLVGAGCDREAGRGVGAGLSRAVPVVIGTAEEREFADYIEALGTARANESIVVSAQVTETVSRVAFEDGQRVAAGDVLVELTSREESAQLREARANYEEAVRQYERAVELRRDGTVSQAQLDAQTTQRDAAEARLGELSARMRDRLIRAPFSGVLGMRTVSPGTLVQPGDAITTLDDIDLIKVDFSVPERFLSVIEPGLVVRSTTAAYPDRRFEGKVRAVDTRLDTETRSVQVLAELANPDHALRPGMLLAIELTANRRSSVSVPEESIVPLGEKSYVFVVDEEQRAQRVELRTGRRIEGHVEVLSGLEPGAPVVVEGGSMLYPGSPVEPVQAAARTEAGDGDDPAGHGG